MQLEMSRPLMSNKKTGNDANLIEREEAVRESSVVTR